MPKSVLKGKKKYAASSRPFACHGPGSLCSSGSLTFRVVFLAGSQQSWIASAFHTCRTHYRDCCRDTMSSFFSAALRLLTQRKPGEGHMSNEHEQNMAGRLNGGGEPPMIPPAHGQAPDAGAIVPRADHRPIYLNPDEDHLTLFRLMLGIQSTPYLGFTLLSPIGERCVVKRKPASR